MVAPARRPKGIVCPLCLAPTAVPRRLKPIVGKVRRKRVCSNPDCGHAEPTVEMTERTLAEMLAAARGARPGG